MHSGAFPVGFTQEIRVSTNGTGARGSSLCQNSKLRIVLVHLLHPPCTAGSIPWIPPSMPPLPPDGRCSPQFNLPRLPSIPWHICTALTKPMVQGRAGGLWPPVCCQPLPSPGATFTKYGRFFLPPVFGTQATAQERSFPDAEVSPALLPSPCSFPAASQWAWPCTHRDRSDSTPSTHWNSWIPHQHPLLLAQT